MSQPLHVVPVGSQAPHAPCPCGLEYDPEFPVALHEPECRKAESRREHVASMDCWCAPHLGHSSCCGDRLVLHRRFDG